MENEKKKRSIWKRIAAIFASALLIFSKGAIDNNKPVPDSNMPKAAAEETYSDTKNYYNLAKHYPDFKQTASEIISLNEMLSVPVGDEVCDTMVPQGLAIKDGMILVSAYDGIDGYRNDLLLHSYKKENREKLTDEKGHSPHNSVIVVLDQKTREVLTTIELPDKNHVGGIAVDDENAYIAKSIDGTISVISLERIKEAAQKGVSEGEKVSKVEYDKNLLCYCDSSFVSLRERKDGKKQLVVGTWNSFPSTSVIRIFDFGKNDELILNQKFNTNSSANGATFVEKDGKEYFIVACSLGRILNSNLFVYEVDEDENGKLSLSPRSQLELPPMIEEVTEFETEDGKRQLAIGSEAFSKRYEVGKSNVISNGIIVTDLDSVLAKKGKTKDTALNLPFDIYKDNDESNEKDDDEKER